MRRVSFLVKYKKDGWQINATNMTNAPGMSSTIEPDFLVNGEVCQGNCAALAGV